MEGYIDLRLKTSSDEKTLSELSTDLKYETDIFGTNVIANQTLSIDPLGINMGQAYTSTRTDLSFNKAGFSMQRANGVSAAIIIDTFYQSVIRISFEISGVNLLNLTAQLNEILILDNLSAAFNCERGTVPFDNIVIEDNPIGLIVKGL